LVLWWYPCCVRLSPRYQVKPEAATAVIELPMMGEKIPETCWAVNKRQNNKLENFCIWLVIYLNCTMMHGLTNFKWEGKFLYHLHTYRNRVKLRTTPSRDPCNIWMSNICSLPYYLYLC
jgi:hypothetical protein